MVAFDRNPMSAGSRHLSSWKEIAHHLGVNLRTAQRWEQECALPIRRVNGARGRVSADTAELDAWKQQRAHTVNHEERCYRWPLGHNVTAEVRFLGPEIAAEHLELLRNYLELFKNALR